jgi:predicted RecA/RadA family phage recombinase
MSAEVVQSVQPAAWSTQSATHSWTFPTMSNTPQADLQLLREPVFTIPGELTAQSVVRLSVPGSGVPATASCHSWFVGRRLPDNAQRGRANGTTVEAETVGVFDLAKVSTDVFAVGSLIYFGASKLATTTRTSNKLIGVAVAAAGNPSATGKVRLNGAFTS